MKTKDLIEKYVQEDPRINTADLARKCGVSRQRIHQLTKEHGIKVAKWGRRNCRPKNPASRAITGGVESNINSTVAGSIGEILVAADLMARGYVPFFPLVPNSKYDLVAVKNDVAQKIEVRCGHKKAGGKGYTFSRKEGSCCDVYAIVITGEPIVYEPDLA